MKRRSDRMQLFRGWIAVSVKHDWVACTENGIGNLLPIMSLWIKALKNGGTRPVSDRAGDLLHETIIALRHWWWGTTTDTSRNGIVIRRHSKLELYRVVGKELLACCGLHFFAPLSLGLCAYAWRNKPEWFEQRILSDTGNLSRTGRHCVSMAADTGRCFFTRKS